MTVGGLAVMVRDIGGDGMLESLGLTAAAAKTYQAMLDHPAMGIEQLAVHCELTVTQVHCCLDELAGLMLVRVSSERPGQVRAVRPEIGLADILARQEEDLAVRRAQLATSHAAVARMLIERAEQRPAHGERLLGLDAIQARIDELGRSTQGEVVGVQPGIQRPEDIATARHADAEAFSRGIAIRTLYQDAVRNHAHIEAHARWLLSQGGEVRTAPVIPQRMIIFDGAHALVPIDPSDTGKGALHVTEPGILAALQDLFEQAWSTAVPLGATHRSDPTTGLTPTERELLRLLGTGLTDDTVAQRLEISSRTVSRHMASIMERLGASSRFEAGIKAAQKQWI